MPSEAYLDRLVLNQGSLLKARQWTVWLQYHLDTLPAGHGWERGLRDTLVGLHHGITCGARRLRRNPIWDLQGSMMDDTERLEDRAMRNLARFEQFRRDIPTRFEKVGDCLYGALRQQVRLAREIDEMRAKGHIDVDVLVDVKNEAAVEQ